jgi:tRNA threonylcarbamoyladenosine biosynthesis protein TsaB
MSAHCNTLTLLAIETSGRAGSVALLLANAERSECFSTELDSQWGSAKTLAPAIGRLVQDRAISMSDLSAIAIVSGPGSFTGLRVGVATAKAMSYALTIPVVEVDALDAIAYQVTEPYDRLDVVMDAYRGQVFCASYRYLKPDPRRAGIGAYQNLTPTRIIPIDEFLRERTSTNKEEIILCGPGCERIQRFIDDSESTPPERASELASRVRWLCGSTFFPQAESVARIASARYQQGQAAEPFSLLPHYYRASAAEEKQRSPD